MNFKHKDGNPEIGQQKLMVRLVVKGFTQKERVDYNDTIPYVVKRTLIRMLLAMVIKLSLEQE